MKICTGCGLDAATIADRCDYVDNLRVAGVATAERPSRCKDGGWHRFADTEIDMITIDELAAAWDAIWAAGNF